MSVSQAPSVRSSPLHTSALHKNGASEWPLVHAESARPSLSARMIGCFRRLRRGMTQPDACDMTPERAEAYQQAFAPFTINVTGPADPDAHSHALEACIPLLFNIRVPSARAQYLRRIAHLAPGYAKSPEQFMQRMLPVIESYGRGFSSREVLQAAKL